MENNNKRRPQKKSPVSRLYDNPLYYEIAFSFRDIAKEVDVFEECIRQYSQVPVKSILELACGQAPHLGEITKRGYRYTGIDISSKMLDFARKRILQNMKAELVEADILDFSLDRKFDFVFILLGSLYVRSSEDIDSHFDCVGRILRKGGLYFLDWCVEFDPVASKNTEDTWVIEHDGIKVKTCVSYEPLSNVEQTFIETISLDVSDKGKRLVFEDKSVRRVIYPGEFLRIIEARKDFEFIGWWNNWDFEYPLRAWPSSIPISRPITLIRRK